MADPRTLVLCAAALAIAAPGYAAAQSALPEASLKTTTLVELDDDDQTARWNGLSVEQLEGIDIVNAEGETIGEVEEVLGDSEGRIVAVTAEIGGFLGIGDREVIVAIDRLTRQGDRLSAMLTREQLESLPAWDDD